jgi:phage baseplate assembly protein W
MSFDLQLIDDDLSIKPDGKIRTVTDTPKLRQDILKAIVTELGSNRFHQWYGCNVNEGIIGQNLPMGILEAEIVSSITETLNRIKALQKTQAVSQYVTLSEMISEVGPIFVSRNPADTRQLNIVVTVYTRQLTKIEEVFTIIS